MSELLSPDVPRRLLTELCGLAAERAAAEQSLRAQFDARNEAAEREFQDAERRSRNATLPERRPSNRNMPPSTIRRRPSFRPNTTPCRRSTSQSRPRRRPDLRPTRRRPNRPSRTAHWEATEAADAARGGLNLPLKDLLAALDGRWQQLESIHRDAVEIMERRGHWRDLPELPPGGRAAGKAAGPPLLPRPGTVAGPIPRPVEAVAPAIFPRAPTLGNLPPALARPRCPLLAMFKAFVWWNWWHWAAATSAVALVVGLVAGVWTYRIAKRKSVEAYLALRRTMLEAGLGYPNVLETAKAECQRLDATIIARHKAQSQKADETFAAATVRIERRRQKELQEADGAYPRRLAELAERRDRMLKEIEDKGPPLLRRIEEQYTAESERIRQRHDQTLEENRRQFDRQWNETANRWRSGIERVPLVGHRSRFGLPRRLSQLEHRRLGPLVAAGGHPARGGFRPQPDKAGRYSRRRVRGRAAAPGADWNTRCRSLLPFPRRSLLMLKAAGPGRRRAVDVMQARMLRLLTAMPPGKVRFTIIDPVGLGDNFSAFMHLADYDEQLVASRIWTDTDPHRAAPGRSHQAHGERDPGVPPPGVPFDRGVQRLCRRDGRAVSRAGGGQFSGQFLRGGRCIASRASWPAAPAAACSCMLSVDTKLPMPRNFQLADLESDGLVLHWAEGHFVWDHPDFGPLAVELRRAPAGRAVQGDCPHGRQRGQRRRAASKCPSRTSSPSRSDWWTTDSRAGLDVPLGRAGAMKFQHLDLGDGTSQHVLISGKTGSGKSTLLHVLITNLALRYSPDEVELYLVDFKKGVEFKAYARCDAAARAGDGHRERAGVRPERACNGSTPSCAPAATCSARRGVQDLKSYRAAEPEAVMPRILLIIDEFQELFVEDDRIAQESALLLDRLVRQGRAFGIHVLLGSQTLGGAYTLARSTIGQMAVRIALQCSEADAHLILSEDNTAARLLTRPGEAIYNDANGLYEGNHPVPGRVADRRRPRRVFAARRAAGRASGIARPPPPIVFEGNVLADLERQSEAHGIAGGPAVAGSPPAVPAWLGSAVAIKDPTAAVFLRQNGSNLLIVGHREEAALGVMASCFISLAAQLAPRARARGEGSGRWKWTVVAR